MEKKKLKAFHRTICALQTVMMHQPCPTKKGVNYLKLGESEKGPELEGEQRQGFKRVELDLRNGTAVSPTGGVEKEGDDMAAVEEAEAEAEEKIRSGGRGEESEREMAIEEKRASYRCSTPSSVERE
jgi:hypothetical protein